MGLIIMLTHVADPLVVAVGHHLEDSLAEPGHAGVLTEHNGYPAGGTWDGFVPYTLDVVGTHQFYLSSKDGIHLQQPLYCELRGAILLCKVNRQHRL